MGAFSAMMHCEEACCGTSKNLTVEWMSRQQKLNTATERCARF
jgi:hypothetical protein